jgi:hypothetical protein
VAGKPKVVVGTKGNEGLSIDRQACSRRARNGRARADPVLSIEGDQVSPHSGIQTWEHGGDHRDGFAEVSII